MCSRKVFLLSIDGWGVTEKNAGNAVHLANTPVMDKLCAKTAQYAQLEASESHVGLPDGVMGNSEVGHLTMGAGRVKYQDLVRVNNAIKDGSLATNPALQGAFDHCRKNSGRLHYLGLVSDGGVHSHINHLEALVEIARDQNIPETFIHFFSDGRDTKPTSSTQYYTRLSDKLKELSYGKIATIIGRYFAMDRDKRWDRIKLAYDLIVKGIGNDATPETVVDKLTEFHESKTMDEMMKPIIIDREGCIRDNDTLVFFDFRSDRMREICHTFVNKPEFETDVIPKNLHCVQMTQYSPDFDMPMMFGPIELSNVLAEWLAKKGLRQFHSAETEKYAHVTFFFNGGREKPFDKEDRVLVQSPKVATYDLAPTMSVAGVKDAVATAMRSDKYEFVMCNFAPPDMVGHTGSIEATMEACAATDVCVGELLEVAREKDYVMLVTSDHGNSEEMLDADDKPKTSHSTNVVPFCIASKNDELKFNRPHGTLSDVAPTVLDIMGLDIPSEMTGTSMLDH